MIIYQILVAKQVYHLKNKLKKQRKKLKIGEWVQIYKKRFKIILHKDLIKMILILKI